MSSLRPKSSPRRRDRARLALPLAVVIGIALAFAPAALADSAMSANWAGYAAHRSGIKFKRVFAAWRQPTATCTPGMPSYSSDWVGLGGFSENSSALEQIGSEVDCSIGGRVLSSVWFEVVPAPSHTIRMKVSPGDQLSASVTVIGHAVTMTINDLTRHRSFTRTVHALTVDASSADWIVEAPSECGGQSFCRLLPLANFGSTTFTRARAVRRDGKAGGISSRGWGTTKITLANSNRRFVANSGTANGAQALPSSLSANGSSFTVTFQAPTSTTTTQPTTSGGAPNSSVLVRPRLIAAR